MPTAQERRKGWKGPSDSAFHLGVAVSSAWHKEFLVESKGDTMDKLYDHFSPFLMSAKEEEENTPRV